MVHAHVIDGTITQVGPLPRLWWDGTRWWDLRDGQTDPTDAGWLPVTEVPRPDDTDTTTHDWSVTLVGDVPTVTWTPREWTPEEVADRTRLDDLEARVTALEAVVMAAAVPDDPADPDVPEWADLTPAGWWYPDTLLRDADGTIYRNTSGTVLTTPPSGFPGQPSQWAHLFVVATGGTDPDPDPDPERPAGYVGTWSSTATYKVGDIVDRDGTYYRCKVAHGPEYQGTWGPPQASVWDVVGPV